MTILHSPSPQLLGIDWGTSNRRAYLINPEGRSLASHADDQGMLAVRPNFEASVTALQAAMGVAADVPIIASGMVGSAQGWREAPYVETPADAGALVAGIVRVTTARGVCMHIVPGVIERSELPNVMRGEETQIVGALASDAIAGSARTLVGLPGTHAKWAVVQGERIESFHTFMTGELYAALRDHTILGRTMTEPAAPDTQAFLRGVTVAKHAHGAGLLATIFSTRTLGLTGQLAREQQPDYLSGLLIGHELSGLEAALAQQHSTLAGSALQLIGNEALCERYRLALAQFGCHQADLVKQATERGLWRIAAQAGLVGEASGAAQLN